MRALFYDEIDANAQHPAQNLFAKADLELAILGILPVDFALQDASFAASAS